MQARTCVAVRSVLGRDNCLECASGSISLGYYKSRARVPARVPIGQPEVQQAVSISFNFDCKLYTQKCEGNRNQFFLQYVLVSQQK